MIFVILFYTLSLLLIIGAYVWTYFQMKQMIKDAKERNRLLKEVLELQQNDEVRE